ncbi:hypothetical protein [Mesoflavibacter sp. CH_XMU1404-2]|uniref:RHS repeat domain-containing protein n=1 Tax=Mesoflavibacter sp. CH_XMU1404-2 TaxID=3107766 RepID=UPI0030097104
MKKIHYLFLLTFLIIFSCDKKSQEIKTDLEKMNLNGNVKSFKTNEFSQLTESHYYFNRSGFISQLNWVSKNSLWHKEKYYYSDNLDSIVRFDKNDDLQSKSVFHYSNGNLIKTQFFNSNNGLERNWKYEYNDQGKISKEVLYYEPNIVISTLIYEYDQSNRLKSKTEIDSHKTTFFYNDKNQKISETQFYFDDNSERKFSFGYDENGFLNRQTDIENNVSYNWNYELDKNGNWIYKRKAGVSLQNTDIEAERKIEYYE